MKNLYHLFFNFLTSLIITQSSVTNYIIKWVKANTEILTIELNRCSNFDSLKIKDGIIEFASMSGFLYFTIEQMPKHFFEKNLLYSLQLLNDETVKSNLYCRYSISNEIESNTLTMLNTIRNVHNNLYSFCFISIQKEWSKFNIISNQNCRFFLGIKNRIVNLSSQRLNNSKVNTQSFRCNIKTCYFEVWLFWTLCVFFFSFFLYISFSIGLVLNKSKKKIMEEKNKAKIQELQITISELDQSRKNIFASLNEKNILLKEIHHRVKNNLQLVMSLLHIQAQDQNNITINEFIEKGQARIASMVLIHENLYQNENNGNIDFVEYLNYLIQNIRYSFGDDTSNIVINIEVNNIFFDIKTATPLGLIINELISNAFKHAFPNNRKGTITILLYKEQQSHDNFVLEIVDNGVGMKMNSNDRNSLGLEIVTLLVMQLNGTLITKTVKGIHHKILFKKIY